MIRFAMIGPAARPAVLAVIDDAGIIPLRDIPGLPLGVADNALILLEHLPAVTEIVRKHKAAPQPIPRDFLAPVPNAPSFRDFYAFEAHVSTCRKKRNLEMVPQWYEQPVFYFSNSASLLGSGAPVYAPGTSKELDYELEIAAVIGAPGRDIPASEAMQHIAGFMILNDCSARDLQRSEMACSLGPAKGKDFASVFGPYLVPVSELKDRIDADGRLKLNMSARVNGKELSRGNSAAMYFTWPQIVEHASRDALLRRGDLLGSGTVGTGCILELGPENTGGWLKLGDVVELEIERLGVLRTPIVARPQSKPAAAEAVREMSAVH
jgi:fumarylacetoacetate (FAA) hydrolase